MINYPNLCSFCIVSLLLDQLPVRLPHTVAAPLWFLV